MADDHDDYLEQLQDLAFELSELIDRRDELITDAYNDGDCTLREIAEALDVSHMTIQRIVRPWTRKGVSLGDLLKVEGE